MLKMDQIISFNKTYEQRLQEYQIALCTNDFISSSAIQNQWGFHLELTMDMCGWQAIWKIPRVTCEKLKIQFPAIVLVYVSSVNIEKLEAFVQILAVQDDIHLPEKHAVKLMQLWPTKQQDESIFLDLNATANVLDMLRFFYNHLWRPWDVDEDDNNNWTEKYLEQRLKLYYDMKTSILPRHMSEHVRSILNEAKNLHIKCTNIEEHFPDADLEDVQNEEEECAIHDLMDIHVRMREIKNEIEMIENPVFRNVLIKRNTSVNKIKNQNNWLVLPDGLFDNYIEIISKAKKLLGSDIKTRISYSLEDALERGNSNDIILINSGVHVIKSMGWMEEGGKIEGLNDDISKVHIESENEDIMLDFSDDVILENLSLNCKSAQIGILVRRGSATLINCYIQGSGESLIHQGFLVLADAKLTLDNCTVTGFVTGITANSSSNIILKNSKITNSEIGLKLFDQSVMKMDNCVISECRKYAVYAEMSKDGPHMFGGGNLLKECEYITATNCTLENNEQDVILAHEQKITPISDLFSNPNFDRTFTNDSHKEEEQ